MSARSDKSRQSKKLKPSKTNRKRKPILSSRQLFRRCLDQFSARPRIFFGLSLIYILLSVFIVKGLGFDLDIESIKTNIDEIFGDEVNQTGIALGLFAYSIAESGPKVGDISGAYQLFIVLIISLATIWSIRQAQANKKFTLKDSFYKGMYPMIPFILVLFVISLQLIPALVGNFLISTVLANSLAVIAIEKFVWIIVYIALLLLSLYMLASSVFALYIVTLPEMTPLKALRSARELVKHRRLRVGLRMIAMPLFLLIIYAALIIPLIYIASWSVEFVVVGLGGVSIIIAHIYLYLLYRELL